MISFKWTTNLIPLSLSFFLLIFPGTSGGQSDLEIPENEESFPQEYSIQDIIKMAKTANYDIRSRAENVYQARKNIQVKIGRLLPGLHFGGILATLEKDKIGLASALLGFLYPSNWFHWKESKYFYQAERKSYSALIANQINAAETLAYKVHFSKMLASLYEMYIQEMNKTLAMARARREGGEDTRDLVLQVENLQYLMKNDQTYLRSSLYQQYTDLAYAIGLPATQWKSFALSNIELPALDQLEEIQDVEKEKYLTTALERSLELSSFRFLISASKYARKARIFEFLSPEGNGDGTLGLGYPSYLRIGKSKTKEVRIKSQEAASNVRTSLEKAVDSYNISLRLFENSNKGWKNAQEWYRLLEEKFTRDGEYDALTYTKAIKAIFKFQVLVLGSQHQFLMAQAQLDRILLNSPHFNSLLRFSPDLSKKKIPFGKRIKNWFKRKTRG